MDVYTDGSFMKGSGHCGIGVVFPDMPERSFGELLPPDVAALGKTNQRAELWAVVRALQMTEGPITIRSDSKYSIGCCTEWFPTWERNGWRNAKGRPVENQDILRLLIPLIKLRKPVFKHVAGHSGNRWNDLADKLATGGVLPARAVAGGAGAGSSTSYS
jgi:ribonuclease HI